VFWDEQGGLLGAGLKPVTLRNDIAGNAALTEAFEKHAKSLHAAYASWLAKYTYIFMSNRCCGRRYSGLPRHSPPEK
jgi:hypothetical protein